MNATKTAANLLPAFLVARALRCDWACPTVTGERIPATWAQAQEWYDAAQKAQSAKHQEVYDSQYAYKMELGGSGNGDAARADANRLADAFAPDLDGAPTASWVDDDGYYGWEVRPDGTVWASTYDALPNGADRRGAERAQLTIPPRGKGDVGLLIYAGATAGDLGVLVTIARALGETPTVEALSAHAAVRPDPAPVRRTFGGYGATA